MYLRVIQCLDRSLAIRPRFPKTTLEGRDGECPAAGNHQAAALPLRALRNERRQVGPGRFSSPQLSTLNPQPSTLLRLDPSADGSRCGEKLVPSSKTPWFSPSRFRCLIETDAAPPQPGPQHEAAPVSPCRLRQILEVLRRRQPWQCSSCLRPLLLCALPNSLRPPIDSGLTLPSPAAPACRPAGPAAKLR